MCAPPSALGALLQASGELPERGAQVACSPEHAFDTWARRTSLWWPPSHSMTSAPAGGGLRAAAGRPDLRAHPAGVERGWGEVLAWEPPGRLAYLWHLGTDRGRATEVDISFTGDAAATTVTIVHRGWERLGADAPGLAPAKSRRLERPAPHFRQAAAPPFRQAAAPPFRQAAAAPPDSGAPESGG
jgi:uncharacterized protein YndB with AHSA1/START domain